jgi:hypothetical protein
MVGDLTQAAGARTSGPILAPRRDHALNAGVVEDNVDMAEKAAALAN